MKTIIPKPNSRELSPFAKFHIALKGYDILHKNKPIYKFEAWWMGYKNANYIIAGKGNIKAVKRKESNNN